MDVLDMNAIGALRDLQDGADDDLLGELIDLFLADAPGRISSLNDAIACEDWDGVSSWAHSLKGSCGSLGAMPMAAVCAQLEAMGRDRSAGRGEAEALLQELQRQFALVRDALQRERGATH